MTDITLFASPGACSRVPMIVLEEIAAPFTVKLIRFAIGEHRSPEFLAINPKGKIPALLVDGEPITENVAIISLLMERFPEAGVMPRSNSALERARQIADLCFCSATLHPIVTRLRIPTFFSAPDAIRSVWEKANEAMQPFFKLIDDRLASQEWWYGDTWSAMDAYLYWVFWRVAGAGFDTNDFPHYSDHARRMEARPAVQRALARENELQQILEQEGVAFTPPAKPAI